MFTTKYNVTRSFLRLGIVITGLLSAIIGILAFFGQNMGTFVISLDDGLYSAGIVLSESKNFETATPRLLVTPMNDTWPVTYSDLKIDEVKNTDGDFKDSDGLTYIGYTFYLKNEGSTVLDIDFNISINSVTRSLDDCIRIMLIEDDVNETIYFKTDSNIHEFDEMPIEKSKNFIDERNISSNKILDFRPSEIKKFSLIIWLEGWDNDCTNDKCGGQIKMEMLFKINKSIIEEQ